MENFATRGNLNYRIKDMGKIKIKHQKLRNVMKNMDGSCEMKSFCFVGNTNNTINGARLNFLYVIQDILGPNIYHGV